MPLHILVGALAPTEPTVQRSVTAATDDAPTLVLQTTKRSLPQMLWATSPFALSTGSLAPLGFSVQTYFKKKKGAHGLPTPSSSSSANMSPEQAENIG